MMGRDRQRKIAAVEAGPILEEPELLSLPDSTDGDQEFRDRRQYMEELKVLEVFVFVFLFVFVILLWSVFGLFDCWCGLRVSLLALQPTSLSH